MSKGTSVDSEDEELFIDVEDDEHHPCYRGFTPLTTGAAVASNMTVLSLQAMVDAVVGCAPVGSPSSSSVMSSRSVVVASSTTSSPRCSPSLCRRRQDSDDRMPASPDTEKTLAHRSNCDGSVFCDGSRGRRRLPDVVQLPSVVYAERRQRHSFLIEEILHPDFGRRRPSATRNAADRRQQFPAEVGVNRVTSIWQPFAPSPTVAEPPTSQHSTERGGLFRTTANRTDGDRKKKSARRKPPAGGVGKALNCTADESASRQIAGHLSSRSSSSSSSSSASCSSGSDVSAESSTNVTCTQSTGAQSKFGKLALPAWVYCTRYSDRPSSGMYSH